jgi:hypothetical protein
LAYFFPANALPSTMQSERIEIKIPAVLRIAYVLIRLATPSDQCNDDARYQYADTRIHKHVQPTKIEYKDRKCQEQNLESTFVPSEQMCEKIPESFKHFICPHACARNFEPFAR